MKKSILIILSITILLLAWQLLAMLVRLPDLVPSVPRLLSTLAALSHPVHSINRLWRQCCAEPSGCLSR